MNNKLMLTWTRLCSSK